MKSMLKLCLVGVCLSLAGGSAQAGTVTTPGGTTAASDMGSALAIVASSPGNDIISNVGTASPQTVSFPAILGGNLTINNSSVTATSALATLNFSGGGILTLNNFNLSNGGIILNGNSTMVLSNGDVLDGGSFNLFSPGLSTVVVQASGNYSLPSSSAYSTYDNLTVATGTTQLTQTTTFGGILSLGQGTNSGTLDLNGHNLSAAGLAVSGGNADTITDSGSSAVLTVNNAAGTISYGGGLTGTNLGLTKDGLGTLTLSGGSANSYGGGTNILNGTLVAAASNCLGSGTVLLGGPFGTSGVLVLSQGVYLANNIGLSGTGTNNGLILMGNNGLSGNLALGGSLFTLNDEGTSGAVNLSGVLSGNGLLFLELSSPTTLVLSGANTYSGTIDFSGGTLGLTNTASLGTAQLNMSGGSTLQETSGNPTISNNIGLAGSVTIDTLTNDLALFGVISGGNLTKAGSGTLGLYGNNTYSGGTSILAGTVFISSDGNLGATSGGVILDGGTLATTSTLSLDAARNLTLGTEGGNLNVGSGTTTTFNGALAGSGALTVTGGGTLLMSGTSTNSATGGTYVTGGSTLSVGLDGELGGVSNGLTLNNSTLATTGSLTDARTITLVSGGALSVGAGTTTTLNGQVTGLGVLNATGSGTLVLGDSSNNYIGGTSVGASATLDISSDGDLGNSSGAVVLNGGTLELTSSLTSNRSLGLAATSTLSTAPGTTSQWSGLITGAGALNITGGGTLILTNNGNNYTVGTNLNAGTLDLAVNNAIGSGILALATGTTLQAGVNGLTVSNAVSLGGAGAYDMNGVTSNLSGVIYGTGSLAVTNGTGSGVVTFSGVNIYSGGTALQAGTLVAANASALGTGNVSVNGGTLALSGPMTLNVGGNYTQSAGTTLALGLGPTSAQWDSVHITGTATLAGTLKLASYGGFLIHDPESFTLLTASAVTGTFDSFTNNVGGDPVSLEYGATNVVLITLPNAPTFNFLGTTGNQKSIGSVLDALATASPSSSLITYLNSLPNSALPGTVDQLSPASLTPLYQMGFATAQAEGGLVGDRVMNLFGDSTWVSSDVSWNGQGPLFAANMSAGEEASMSKDLEAQRWGVFANGLGNFGTVTGDANGPGYQYSTGGMAVGMDYRFSKDFVEGLLLSYSSSGNSQSTGTVNSTGGQAGLYVGWRQESLHWEVLVAGGVNNYTTKREALGGTAAGSTSGTQFSGQLGLGYDLRAEDVKIEPFAAGQYTNVAMKAFTETGSLAPLSFGAQSEDYLTTDLGARVAKKFDMGGWSLAPEVSASWEHLFQGNLDSLSANFDNGSSFTVNGPAMGTDAAVLGGGVKLSFAKGFGAYAQYQGKVGLTNYTEQNLSLGVNIGF